MGRAAPAATKRPFRRRWRPRLGAGPGIRAAGALGAAVVVDHPSSRTPTRRRSWRGYPCQVAFVIEWLPRVRRRRVPGPTATSATPNEARPDRRHHSARPSRHPAIRSALVLLDDPAFPGVLGQRAAVGAVLDGERPRQDRPADGPRPPNRRDVRGALGRDPTLFDVTPSGRSARRGLRRWRGPDPKRPWPAHPAPASRLPGAPAADGQGVLRSLAWR